MDEFNAKAPNAGSKKRAALANLTNHSSSSRQVAQIANKSQVHCDNFLFLFWFMVATDLLNSLNDIMGIDNVYMMKILFFHFQLYKHDDSVCYYCGLYLILFQSRYVFIFILL